MGQSYLNMLCTEGVSIGNVTFEPGCRNNWHIHHAKSGGWLSSNCCNYYFGGRYDGKDNLNFFDRIFNAFYFRVQFLSRGRTTAS